MIYRRCLIQIILMSTNNVNLHKMDEDE